MKKVVVFGGSGFLGSHVADALVNDNYNVIIFDLANSKYITSGAKMVIGDILDVNAVDEVIEGADYVYDFAGIADLDDASTRPVDTVMLNVVGTCNILDACIIHKVKRFVYASSFYTNSEKGGFYRCSKQAAEIYIEEYQRKYNLNYTILRYGSLYGPRSGKNNGIRQMLSSALKYGIINYRGTGEEVREYIHVKDAAMLSVKVLGREYSNKHIVLTGHDSYRIKDIIQVIGEVINKDIKCNFEENSSELHYNVTPYMYKFPSNYKMVSDFYHELGQGLIECIDELMYEDE